MYNKLLKAFILRNLSLFIIIVVSMSLSMVGYFVSSNLITNAQNLIAGEIKPILWWDIIIDTGNESREDIVKYFEELQNSWSIEYVRDVQILTNIQDAEWNFELTSLAFVDEGFPFYANQQLEEINPFWTAVVNEAAYKLSNNNALTLFDSKYNIKAIIKSSGTELNVFANARPQVSLPYDSIKDSWISWENSLLENNIYIKVLDEKNFDSIIESIKQNSIFDDVRVQNYKAWWDRFRTVIETLSEFINYILITSFLFSVLIIFLSIESFFISEKKTFSILKILGLNIYKLIVLCLLIFALIFMLSFGISWVAWEAIFAWIRSFDISSGFILYASSIPTGLYLWAVILVVSILAPLLKFIFHSPLDGLKQNFLQIYKKSEVAIQVCLVLLGIFTVWYLLWNSVLWSLIASWVIILSIVILIAVISLLLRLVYKVFGARVKAQSFIKYDAIRNTVKPWNLSGIIVLSFIIIYCAFIFISTLFLNFYERLNLDVNNDKNIFIINLNEEGYNKLDNSLQTDTYKILRARVSEINGVELEEHLENNNVRTGRWRFTREFNITDNALPDVKVIDGVAEISSWEVSIDAWFSKDSKIVLWDKVEFLVFGLKKTLTVTNVRESLQWSVTPFFFFQVYPEDFQKFPKTYFVATNVPSEDIQDFKREVIAKVWSSASFIEVDEILKQVKSISVKILTLIQTLYGYIMLFSVISVVICIRFFKIFQGRKSQLYHTLGAWKNSLSRNAIFEYNYLQSIWVAISILLASIWSYAILSRSDFIDFSLTNYLYSIIWAAIIFILISLFIRYSMKSSN